MSKSSFSPATDPPPQPLHHPSNGLSMLPPMQLECFLFLECTSPQTLMLHRPYDSSPDLGLKVLFREAALIPDQQMHSRLCELPHTLCHLVDQHLSHGGKFQTSSECLKLQSYSYYISSSTHTSDKTLFID